jgi:small GTP-binding protein
MDMKREYNILIVGDEKVGKTTFIKDAFNSNDAKSTQYYVKNYNTSEYTLKYNVRNISNDEKSGITLKVWDTPGNAKQFDLFKNNYKNVDCIVYMFDQSNATSFINLKCWKKKLSQLFASHDRDINDIPSLTIGNKCDNINIDFDYTWKTGNDIISMKIILKNGIEFYNHKSSKYIKTIYKRAFVNLMLGKLIELFDNNIRINYIRESQKKCFVKTIDQIRTIFTLNGVIHNDCGPAIIYKNGDKCWYLRGMYHRDEEDGPAVILSNGSMHYYKNGLEHRESGPAIITSNGELYFYINGKLHREHGPSMVTQFAEHWYKNGHLHREDGPAFYFHNEIEKGSYYLEGKQFYSTEEFWNHCA